MDNSKRISTMKKDPKSRAITNVRSVSARLMQGPTPVPRMGKKKK